VIVFGTEKAKNSYGFEHIYDLQVSICLCLRCKTHVAPVVFLPVSFAQCVLSVRIRRP
jgi:hypothetical protein